MRQFLLFLSLISLFLFISTAHAEDSVQVKIDQTTKQETIGRLFSAVELSIEQKQYKKAIELYHHILDLDPTLVQIRFSLAETYLLLKKYDQAHYHFKLVLAQEIPAQISQIIRRHLAFINRQKIWQFSYGFNVTPESNINQGSNNKVIFLGGLPFTLNDDALAQSGVNINAHGALLISPKLSDSLYGHFKISASGNFLSASKQLNYNLGSELGLTIKQKSDKFGAGLAYNAQFFNQKPYSQKLGIWALWDKLLTDKLTWEGHISASNTSYNNVVGTDYNFRLYQSIQYEHNAQLGFNLSPTISYKKSLSPLNSKLGFGLTLGSRHSLAYGFTINTNLSADYSQYFAQNTLFNKKRKDLDIGIGLKVANSKLRIFDFAPYIQYRFQLRKSNIELYNYTNHSVSFGLTARF